MTVVWIVIQDLKAVIPDLIRNPAAVGLKAGLRAVAMTCPNRN